MADSFTGTGRPLSQDGVERALAALDVEPAALWALVTVETRGFGFLPDRRLKLLFERHVFHARTRGRFAALAPDLSAPSAGGYAGGAAEYERLGRAIELDRVAALESASWGLPQIMGFNATTIGYGSAGEMIERFLEGEDHQLDGAARFLTRNAALWNAFRQKDWDVVARHYNGPAYAEHG